MMKYQNFELCLDQPLKQSMQQILRSEFERARSDLTDASRDPEDRVHNFRKATKRLRALLRLIEADLGPNFRSSDRELRDAARLFSDTRDQVVLRETAQRLDDEAKSKEEFVAIEGLHDALSQGDRMDPSAAPSPEAVESALALLDRAHGRVGPVQVRTQRLGIGLLNTYRKARTRLKAARTLDDDALHSLRKSVKYHRYQLRLLRASYRPVLNAERGVAREISELLGDDHDLVVLKEALSALRLDASTQPVLVGLIAKQRQRLQERALHLCDRLLMEKPKVRRKRLLGYFEQALEEEQTHVKEQVPAEEPPPAVHADEPPPATARRDESEQEEAVD